MAFSSIKLLIVAAVVLQQVAARDGPLVLQARQSGEPNCLSAESVPICPQCVKFVTNHNNQRVDFLLKHS